MTKATDARLDQPGPIYEGWMPSQGQEDLYDRLDPGIRDIVRVLREHDIETTESCEGTPGHCYPEPTVCFQGTQEAGYRAVALCFAYGLKVKELRRVWHVQDGELTGPDWELTFWSKTGGLQLVERLDGKFRYTWGPLLSPTPESEAMS